LTLGKLLEALGRLEQEAFGCVKHRRQEVHA
jgi:hypothetical protein